MVFSKYSQTILLKMRIDPHKYSKDLKQQFSSEQTKMFELVVQEFFPTQKAGAENFEVFMETHKCDYSNDKFRNYLQEWHNNLCWFNDDGVLFLFQNRNPDWGTPEVRITREDVGVSDVDQLSQKLVIYRGMSEQEHKTGKYRQSWTLDKNAALRFARTTYEEQKNGIVVETKINRDGIIYYDKLTATENSEYEVIIEHGRIHKNNVRVIIPSG